jgi:hypothetical protein
MKQTINEKTSFVGMVFTEEGSSEGFYANQNVTPMQVLLAGNYLIKIAGWMLSNVWESRKAQLAKEKEALEEYGEGGIIKLQDDKIIKLH